MEYQFYPTCGGWLAYKIIRAYVPNVVAGPLQEDIFGKIPVLAVSGQAHSKEFRLGKQASAVVFTARYWTAPAGIVVAEWEP